MGHIMGSMFRRLISTKKKVVGSFTWIDRSKGERKKTENKKRFKSAGERHESNKKVKE